MHFLFQLFVWIQYIPSQYLSSCARWILNRLDVWHFVFGDVLDFCKIQYEIGAMYKIQENLKSKQIQNKLKYFFHIILYVTKFEHNPKKIRLHAGILLIRW